MKKAVIYGAGNIGRGFVGQVLHDSGYEVAFLDINRAVTDALNRDGGYTLRIVSNEGTKDIVIDGVYGVDAGDGDRVASEIAQADIMATSIGVRVLPHIAGNIARGIEQRKGRPLNILLCENLLDAAKYVRALLAPCFADGNVPEGTGLVNVTIGRMVPALTKKEAERNPTLVKAEEFCTLPVDARGMVGSLPELEHVTYYSDFRICEEQKLFIHNMSHALCAYLGYRKGYTYIWEAAEDRDIKREMEESMLSVCSAVGETYETDAGPLRELAEGLIERYGNRKLGDPVRRVGRDPMRKLRPDDRLVGAMNRCKGRNKPYDAILKGIAAALRYGDPEDGDAMHLQEVLKEKGAGRFLREYCRLDASDMAKCLFYLSDFGRQGGLSGKCPNAS